jgi:hypothetical protein
MSATSIFYVQDNEITLRQAQASQTYLATASKLLFFDGGSSSFSSKKLLAGHTAV